MFSMRKSNAFCPLIIPKKKEEWHGRKTSPAEKRYIYINPQPKQERSNPMRKSTYTLLLACALATTGTAQAQSDRQAEKARTEQAVQKALDERRFCIDVNYMNPMRGRGRALTTPYSLTVRNDSVLSYLPYVGQAYSVPYDGGKALNFSAPISAYEMKEGKRGRKNIKFTTSNDEDTYIYTLTVFPNGSTSIHVQPTRRQSISFNGEMVTEK